MPEWTVATQTFCITKERFKKISWQYQRRRYIAFQTFGLAIACIGSIALSRYGHWPLFLFIGSAFLVYMHLVFHFGIVRTANNKQNQSFYMPMKFIIDDMKLHIEQEPDTMSEAPWSRIVSYFVCDGDLVLLINSMTFWYLPRSAFDSAEDWSRVYNHVVSTISLRK